MKTYHTRIAVLIRTGFQLATLSVHGQVEGPLLPSLAEDDVSSGDQAWTDLTSVYSDDGSNTTVDLLPGETSHYLVIRDLGFALPEGSIVNGISINVEKSKSAGFIKDQEVRLFIGGVPMGDDKASITGWTSSGSVETYGAEDDSWGLSLSAADVNDPTFGIGIRAVNTGGGGPARAANVDFVDVTVGYSVPLPIHLLSFNAHLTDNRKVSLEWKTGTEINNEYFTLERSRNGATFEEVGRVPGHGTSNTPLSYSFVDENPISGTSYYRLKQTDFNGDFEYFHIVAVDYQNTEGGSCVLKVYPNPCPGTCTVQLSECSEEESAEMEVEMLDASGQRVYSRVPVREADGSFSFQVDVHNNLKPGIYIVSGKSAKETYTKKIITK
ncbi:MAG: T9SS type A sorting domain-containing protein [Flavobacteriales bacterium]|nr:T9SS type A sorting domain-containing protein [Flavobacteriales bacterium]MCB9449504.1 T9SS type A sorting domain-containing protein [Flavobacteriales bacterium]